MPKPVYDHPERMQVYFEVWGKVGQNIYYVVKGKRQSVKCFAAARKLAKQEGYQGIWIHCV